MIINSSHSLFKPLCFAAGTMVLLFILLPLAEMVTQTSPGALLETMHDEEVRTAIFRSLSCSGTAAAISFVFGTPIAYLLARSAFTGKKVVESIIDLPIMIPHPVVGIAILSIAGKNHWIGKVLHELGIYLFGTITGIITVLTFVALPFLHQYRKSWISNGTKASGAGCKEPWCRSNDNLFPHHHSTDLATHVDRFHHEYGQSYQ